MAAIVTPRPLTVAHRAGTPAVAGLTLANLATYDTDAEDAFFRATSGFFSSYWEANRNRGASIANYEGAATDSFDAVSGAKFTGAGSVVEALSDGKFGLTVNADAARNLSTAARAFDPTLPFTILLVVEQVAHANNQTIWSTANGPGGGRVGFRTQSTAGAVGFDNRTASGDTTAAPGGTLAVGRRDLIWGAYRPSDNTASIGRRNAAALATSTWASDPETTLTGEYLGTTATAVGPFNGAILMRAVIPAFGPTLTEFQAVLDAVAVKFAGNGLS